MEYDSVRERNMLSSPEKTWKKAKCLSYVREANLRRLPLYGSNYMTFWKRQNYTVKRSMFARGWGGRKNE